MSSGSLKTLYRVLNLYEQSSEAAPRPSSKDGALFAAALGRLEAFAEGLDARERAALAALLYRATPGAALAALGSEAPEAALEPGEFALVEELDGKPAPRGGLTPSLVLVMKATRRCNLRCTYCHFWSDAPDMTMPFEVLARATHGALSVPGVKVAEFVWHGGEATLMPLAYYRKAFWLQQRYRQPGQHVSNALQTNGTHLTPAWIDFLRCYGISVGISLDGPPEVHDARRLDVAGRPTSAQVREGLARVAEAKIEHGVLMVVDDDVMTVGAERLLAYFLELGVNRVALLNAIPENMAANTGGRGTFMAWQRFVSFLRELFHVWWPRYVDRISFREISDLLGKIEGRSAGICVFNGNCMGGFLTIEPNGDIAACDKYMADPDFRFGNVCKDGGFAALASSRALARAREDTAAGIELAAGCPWFTVCQGGCPHDRYLRQSRGIAHDERCCGLAPLLSDMADALQENQNTASPVGVRAGKAQPRGV